LARTLKEELMNNLDLIETNEINKNAKGGTELLTERLYASLSRELLEQVQIIPSRVRELDESKIRIFWAHDCETDPEAQKALGNNGWNRFHKIVFVSHWQAQRYIEKFNIPWSKCEVILNSIHPLPSVPKSFDGPIKVIYTPTPHRGLDILTAAWELIQGRTEKDIHLDVYSSFSLYGWSDRDKDFEPLYDRLRSLPSVTYHGTKRNDEVRLALTRAHVFAYPSTYTETSCLCLIEAMSAGLACVHPNFGALPETAANWTEMYQYHEDKQKHAELFASVLLFVINNIELLQPKVFNQKQYADIFYSWDNKVKQWEFLISKLLSEPREIPQVSTGMFTYRTS
jgi:UDP-glucose:(glucosyl)LPS alpha-1,2-glucosyltransferase